MSILGGRRKELASTALRAVTMLSKFVFVIYAARVLSASDMGVYGLFVAGVGIFVYILGMDFYTYSTRQLLALPKSKWPAMIRDQFVLYVGVYCCVVPITLFIFYYNFLSWSLVGWFYLVLTLEHISQELYRLLIAAERQVEANLALFLRSGSWAYILIVLVQISPDSAGLSTVFALWSAAALLSLVVPGLWLSKLSWSEAARTPIDRAWIRRGISVALLFFAGTLAMRIVFTVDRSLLKYFQDPASVGAYVFYFYIANSVASLSEAGVTFHAFPRLIGAKYAGDGERFNAISRDMSRNIVLVVCSMSIIIVLGIPYVLSFVGKPVYSENIALLWILLVAMGLQCLSYVPHYKLYAFHADRALALVSLSAMVIMCVLSGITVPVYGALGAAIALASTMMFVVVAKNLVFQRIARDQ